MLHDNDRLPSGDAAGLCLRLNPSSAAPDLSSLAEAAGFLGDLLEQWEIAPRAAARAQIALDEICSNIVRYSGASELCIDAGRQADALTLVFSDDGAPFDPTVLDAPDVTLDADEREVGGLGIFMVRRSTREMRYERADGRNRLTLVFAL